MKNTKDLRKYKPDDNFFNTPNLENCYWAGFIAADGWISVGCVVNINILSKDIEHLEKFKKVSKFNGNIAIYKKQTTFSKVETSQISIRSKQWVIDLYNNFNITPRKSLTLIPPNLTDKNLILSFIKGYLDGDGSLELKKRILKNGEISNYFRISFRGTKEVLLWIKNNFDIHFPISRKKFVNLSTSNNHPEYKVAGKRTLEIIKYLYNLNTDFLNRKWSYLNLNSLTYTEVNNLILKLNSEGKTLKEISLITKLAVPTVCVRRKKLLSNIY